MPGVRDIRRLVLWSVCTCVLLTPALNAQEPAAEPVARHGMKVLEFDTPAATASQTYSIVGAVSRSGVFTSDESSLPLWKLLAASGGLKSYALPSLRVIRRQHPRFQIPLELGQNSPQDMLQPGDIVVVGSRLPWDVLKTESDSPETIPIICTGLLEYPVMLPLDPTIQSLPELIQRLGQSPDLMNHTVLFDPEGRRQTNQLVPGSVVAFDASFVNQSILKQPGALPSPTPLAPAMPMAPGLSAGETASMSVRSIEASANENGTVSPAGWIESTAAQAPVSRGESLLADAATQRDIAVPLLPLPGDAVAGSNSETPQSGSRIEAASTLTALPAHASSKQMPLESAAAAPTSQNMPSPEIEVPVPTKNDVAEATALVSRQAPLPPLEEESLAEAFGVASLADGAKTPQSHSTENASSGALWPIWAGVAGLFIVIATAAWAWPRSLQRNPVATAIDDSSAPVDEPVRETEDVAEPVTTDTSIQGLLSRTVPLVEEQIILGQRALHGRVVGDRRIKINEAHLQPPAPHFARSESEQAKRTPVTARSAASERALRASLKAVFKKTENGSKLPLETSDESVTTRDLPDGLPDEVRSILKSRHGEPHHHSPAPQRTPSPANPAVKPQTTTGMTSGTFDIVQPQHQATQAAMGPLERALRTLASETRDDRRPRPGEQ